MTSLTFPRERVSLARSTVVQFVSGETGSLAGFKLKLSTPRENLPVRIVVVRCHYRSAAEYSSQAGSDDWSRKLNPLPASGSFFRQGRAGFLNFRRLFTGMSFRSLHHALQKPCSVFCVSSRPSLRVVAHEEQRKEGLLSWVTRNVLRVTKCL